MHHNGSVMHTNALYLVFSLVDLLIIISDDFIEQYGPIVKIDLKFPPRPPGYCFIEVCYLNSNSIFCVL